MLGYYNVEDSIGIYIHPFYDAYHQYGSGIKGIIRKTPRFPPKRTTSVRNVVGKTKKTKKGRTMTGVTYNLKKIKQKTRDVSHQGLDNMYRVHDIDYLRAQQISNYRKAQRAIPVKKIPIRPSKSDIAISSKKLVENITGKQMGNKGKKYDPIKKLRKKMQKASKG